MTDESSTTPPSSKKKKKKVRDAWISFIGRIVAQIVGAAASVVLGVMVLQTYHNRDRASSSQVTEGEQLTRHRAQRAPGELAIAVLPLQNYSADQRHAYFADGVTEALITDLAQIKGLLVTSRTSSMAYKATTKPLPQISSELGVDLILEGSIVRDNDRVRVTAQLIDAGTDQHLWARSYDRAAGDVLALQSDVATAIARDVNMAIARFPARLALLGPP